MVCPVQRHSVEDKNGPRDAGYLLTSDGTTVDPRDVARMIQELAERYRIRAIAADRWKLPELQRALTDAACTVPLIEHGMGYASMSSAVNLLEQAAFEKRLRHGGNPLLRSAVANTRIEMDHAANRKPAKNRSTGRIDPCAALMLSLSAIHNAPPPWWPVRYVIRQTFAGCEYVRPGESKITTA